MNPAPHDPITSNQFSNIQSTNWGIIAPGRIARKFADDLRLVPGAKLHAVASTNLGRAEEFAKIYDVPHVFGKYEDIVKCPDLDVVYIATPHTGHCAATVMCLENGLPVLCEKAFAMNLAEAKLMTSSARKNGVFLMEALWTRFIPAVREVFNLLKNNEIGEVHTIRSSFGFHAPFDPEWRIFNKKLGGGSLLDVGVYPILLSNFVFGKPKTRDILAAATFTETGVDKDCAMIFKFDGGKLSILNSTISSNVPMIAQIFGKKGTITLHPRWHHTQKISISEFDDPNRTEIVRDLEFPYEGWGYSFEQIHVMECLQQNLKESPLVPLKFSEDLMATLDAVRGKIGLKYD